MGIYQIGDGELTALYETTFQSEGLRERQDLQSLLRDSIGSLAEGLMVLAEEFGDWDDSRRRIDLLCLDRKANLVVVELKRTEDGGHMDLQAIRYAAMVSKMTFPAAVEAHRSYLARMDRDADSAENEILAFLDWEEPKEEDFANDVRIILASAEFSKEIMTAVIWLSEHDIDVSCVRMKPFKFENTVFLDIQQIFPLPEAADYQIKIREKERRERQARQQGRNWDKKSFLEHLENSSGADGKQFADIADKIIDWTKEEIETAVWGKGAHHGSLSGKCQNIRMFSIWTAGTVGVPFGELKKSPAFSSDAARRALINRLNAELGANLEEDDAGKDRSFSLMLLTKEGALERFFSIFRDVQAEISNSNSEHRHATTDAHDEESVDS